MYDDEDERPRTFQASMREVERYSATSDTRPCPFCAETIKAAAIKCRHCGSAIAPTSVAQPHQAPPLDPQPQPPAGKVLLTPAGAESRRTVIILLALAGIAIASVATYKIVKSKIDDAAPPTRDARITNDASRPSQPPRSAPVTSAQRLASATTLEEAVVALPLADAVDTVDPGSAMLAVWASTHMKWSDVADRSWATYAEVMKDPSGSRGKRTCFSGSIIEIAADRTTSETIWVGGLSLPGMDFVRFAAVGDSTGILEGSSARLCGVVTGRYDYKNQRGGSTGSVFVVGMLDTPANRAAK